MFEKLETLRYRRIVKDDRHDPVEFDLLAEITGFSIPADYATFQRRFPDSGRFELRGGVSVRPRGPLPAGRGNRLGVELLYAGCSVDDCDLFEIRQEQHRDPGDFVPLDYLPIGEDARGNEFCLALAGEDTGCVFYLDQDDPVPILVADGFTAFIDALEAKG
jgi:hypothetical protein